MVQTATWCEVLGEEGWEYDMTYTIESLIVGMVNSF